MVTREIKFRVWTGHSMEHNIVVGGLGAFYAPGLDPNDSDSISTSNTIYPAETPVMQFTGLYDANGVEIYEGDILAVRAHVVDEYESAVIEKTALVVWRNEHVTYCLEDASDRESNDKGMNTYKYAYQEDSRRIMFLWRTGPFEREVLGNIYENPELIKRGSEVSQ